MNIEIKLDKNNPFIKQSLTCAQYAELNNTNDNRALATIGDSLLSFIFLDLISRKEYNITREELTNWKEIIQDNSIQNAIDKLFFEDHIFSANNDVFGKKVYATILEAYIYALYKSSKLSNCFQFIEDYLCESLKKEQIHQLVVENFKCKSKEPTKGKDWDKVINDFERFFPINYSK